MSSEIFDDQSVLASLDGAVWRLTINRADARNALAIDVARALRQHVSHPPDAARVIVLTGAGSTFCAGGDLRYLLSVAKDGPEAVSSVIYAEFQGLVRAMLGSRLPIIAAINGPAIGAGLDLALACDFRIASATAKFSSAWIKLGLVTGMGGSWLLTRALGGARATEMLLLGEAISADTALRVGLVNAIATTPEEWASTLSSYEQRLTLLPAEALAETRASIRRALDQAFESELSTLARVQGRLLSAPEFTTAAEKLLRPKS